VPERLRWERDGARWPLHEASRFVAAGGVRWHVQVLGPAEATVALLIHGTGAATHSWRLLAPRLARDLRVVAVDLPGHGFSSMAPRPGGMSLPGMAGALGALLATLGLAPALVVGHSAGAAIGARLVLDGLAAPHALVALNGALLPLGGPGRLFSPLARLLAFNPLVPAAFAWMARDQRLAQRLLAGTGSSIDATGAALYARLVADPGHAAGALAMMAQWDLAPLAADLPRLAVPLHLVVAEGDLTVPPAHAERIRAHVPGARLHRMPALGHLAHEERPELVEALLRDVLGEQGRRSSTPATGKPR
jgi:magnesium chelatase accessory protein